MRAWRLALSLCAAGLSCPAIPISRLHGGQSQANNASGVASEIVTIDLVVMSRDEGGRLARDAIAEVSRAVREVSLEMEG
jgi:hypothetical protein